MNVPLTDCGDDCVTETDEKLVYQFPEKSTAGPVVVVVPLLPVVVVVVPVPEVLVLLVPVVLVDVALELFEADELVPMVSLTPVEPLPEDADEWLLEWLVLL